MPRLHWSLCLGAYACLGDKGVFDWLGGSHLRILERVVRRVLLHQRIMLIAVTGVLLDQHLAVGFCVGVGMPVFDQRSLE